MKAQVVFESMFGNSAQVARAIVEGRGRHGEIELTDVASSPPGAVAADIDCLVVGGPTHAFSMSRRSTREDAIRQGATHGASSAGLREWLRAADADLAGLPCAAFDTRVARVRRLPGSAAHVAARALRRRRGRVVVPPMSFFVDDVAGPLSDAELDRARNWGDRVGAAALAAATTAADVR
jgi:hypothetical protein